jgi:hypothetical protein
MAFDRHEMIFVHIPKTAGISLTRTFFPDLHVSHTPIRIYKMLYQPEVYDSYFKFAFVRNPWDRLVSAFHYLKRGGRTKRDRLWAAANLAPYENFAGFARGWVNQDNVYSYVHFIPQHEFLCDRHLQIEFDYIGRFESIEDDFKYIGQRLRIGTNLPHYNRGAPRPDYRTFYDRETKAIVGRVYRDDIELLSYTFDGVSYAG